MFGLGVPELMMILLIGLIVFGPGKLPSIGSALGKSMREFKEAVNDTTTSVQTIEAKPAERANADGKHQDGQ